MSKWTGIVLLLLGPMAMFQPAANPPEATESIDDPAVDLEIRTDAEGSLVLRGQPVRTLFAPRIERWYRIGWQQLVVYVPRSGPYLITLQAELNGLGRATSLDPQLRRNTLSAQDNLSVYGHPYGIKRIEKIDEATALRIHGEVDPERGY